MVNNWAATELAEMAAAKRLPPLKRLLGPRHIYATPESAKKDKGEHNIDHDLKLRDVVAKYLYVTGYREIEKVSVQRIPWNPDAHIGSLYFELDNGHEDDAQLAEKLQRYSGAGAFRVIFVMAHRYGDASLEVARLKKLLTLGNALLGQKPNRVLAATYHQYLTNGRLMNLKQECR